MEKSKTQSNHRILDDPYLNRVFLKIKRNHPESVGIQLLEEEIKKIKIENGKNIAYIAELEDTLLKFQKMSPEELSFWKLCEKENTQIKELEEKLEKALKNVELWKSKYFKLFTENKKA